MNILLISILASFLPICTYILFIYWLDRYEREPIKFIILTFILGATFSTFFSYIENTLMMKMSYSLLTQAGAQYVSTGIFAPLIEETNKGLIILLLAWLSREFDNATDGLVYGAIVGLGFAFTENILYFTRVYEDSGQFAWIHNMYLRGFFSAGVHASTCAILGGCIGYARFSRWPQKILMLVMGGAIAVMIHSFWNSVLTVASLSADNILSLLPFACIPLIYLFLFILFQFNLSQESQIIEKELLDEAQNGFLPIAHIPYLKSYIKRSKTNWLDAKINKKEYLKLTTELAFKKNQHSRVGNSKKEKYAKEIENLRGKIKALNNQSGSALVIFIVIIAIIGFFIGAAFFGTWAWNYLLVKFPTYKIAQSYLNTQPEVQKIVGNITKWDKNPAGEFFYNKQGGEGKLELKVEGAFSKGEIFLKFKNESGELWIIKQASLKTPTIKQPLPLTIPDDWLASAKKLVQQNKMNQAMEECARIRTAVPDDYIGEYCLAEIELAKGNTTAYLDIFKKIKDKNPNYYHYQYKLGYAYYVTVDDQNALIHFKKAWDLNPLPSIARDIASVHLNLGEVTQAVEWLKKAEEKGDQSAELNHLYGRYYLVRKEYQQAKDFFTQALKVNPYYSDSYFGLAYTYQDLINIPEAIYYYELGFFYAPWSSLKHRKNLITLLLQNKMTDEVTYHLKKVIEYHPSELPPYDELARIYVSQQRWDEAKNVIYELSQIDQSRANQLQEQLGIPYGNLHH